MRQEVYQVLLIEPTGSQAWWMHYPEYRGDRWTVRPYGGGLAELPNLKTARRALTTKIGQGYIEAGYSWEIRKCLIEVVDDGPKSPLRLLAEQAE